MEQWFLLDLVAHDRGRTGVGEGNQPAAAHAARLAETLVVLSDDAQMRAEGAAHLPALRRLPEQGLGDRYAALGRGDVLSLISCGWGHAVRKYTHKPPPTRRQPACSPVADGKLPGVV